MVLGLHAVQAAIWWYGTVPPDLLRGVVIPLWKEMGLQQLPRHHPAQYTRQGSCSLLRRIRDYLLRHQRLERSGFTPVKSIIDCILVFRVIVEHHCEFGRGLLAAYIDLTKTFDTVHWESLGDLENERNSNKDY